MKNKKDIQTVIVGVDFSRYSKAVVRQARAISKNLRVPLVFIHVYKNPVVAEQNAALIMNHLNGYYEKQLRTRYAVKSNEIVVVECGTTSEDIIATAKKYSKPLIVVGHRGNRSAVSNLFLGSTAETLALRSSFPVLICRGQKTILPRKILIPCDFSRRSKNAIEGSKNIGFSHAHFELFHVMQQSIPLLDYELWISLQNEIKELNDLELRKFKKKNSRFKIVESMSNDIVGEIKRKSKSFDLIAISPREHKGIFSSFGSITSKVVRTGNTSVLVIP